MKFLKLTSVLSLAAFMAVAMFSTPVSADAVSANDVLVEANYADLEEIKVKEAKFITPQCWVYKCEYE